MFAPVGFLYYAEKEKELASRISDVLFIFESIT